MKPKILIVDDEPSIIDAIQYVLETEGCETRAALSGEEARKVMAAETVDLAILDIGLPDINGLELLKLIRQSSQMPVIFLTARATDLDRILGLELGGDDYVVKPFSPRELAARVKAVLRRGCGGRGAPALPAVWRIDEQKRRIDYYGQPLDLSRYEYNLLMVLLRRPGQVFSRERLMDLAWDEPLASLDRTIDSHIKNIRAKLKLIRPEIDSIVTHRGVGYSLKETP